MPHSAPDPMVGLLVGGRYRLVQRIGSGGMGVVWSAEDEVLRRRVAVKELRHGWGSSDRTFADARRRSLREARAAATLDHPNIVAVYDMVEHGDRPWIVMEFVAGRSLKDVVAADGPLTVERVTRIGSELLSALQAAHTAGITHRDVKPANVLISDRDQVRLTDFGLATLPDGETLTQTGAVLGTPGYLAPEQAQGSTPGPPADIFGLAATLYHAVEGVGPFERDGYLPMLVAYARHEIRPPRRAGALAPVLLRMLAADPDKRPTGEQARQMLLGGAVRRRGPSRRLLVAGGAAAALAAGGGLWAGGRRPWERPATPSAAPAALPSASPARPVGLGMPLWKRDDLPMSLMVGSTLVSSHPDGVLAVDPQTGARRWLRGPGDVADVRGAGTSMVVVEGKDDYRVLDAGTGAVRWQHSGENASVGCAAGLYLVTPFSDGRNSEIIGHDAATGRRIWRLRTPGHVGTDYFDAGGMLCTVITRNGAFWLYGIRPRTGDVAWKTRLSADVDLFGLWAHGDHVYAANLEPPNWTLIDIDARTGKRGWAVPLVKYPGTPGTDFADHVETVEAGALARIGDLVVAGVTDRQLSLRQAGLIALDAATGAVRWRRPLLNPCAVAAGDRLFAGSYDSVLHELDPGTGKTLWSVATPGPVSRLDAFPATLVAVIGQGAIAYPLLPG